MSRKKKITKTLTFKIICAVIALMILGIAYNFVVNIKDTPPKIDEEQEEEQVKASKDTIDIIGDYLWGSPKKSETKETENAQDATEEEEKEQKTKDTKSASGASSQSSYDGKKESMPAPAHDVESNSGSGEVHKTQESSTGLDKIESPKVEKIE